MTDQQDHLMGPYGPHLLSTALADDSTGLPNSNKNVREFGE